MADNLQDCNHCHDVKAKCRERNKLDDKSLAEKRRSVPVNTFVTDVRRDKQCNC